MPVKLAVVDGQGGGIGFQIIRYLRNKCPQLEIIALGTNAVATANMMKAQANRGASGENAIRYSLREADMVVGPLSILIPNAMMGELTPAMAEAIASCPARKILLPLVNQPEVEVLNIVSEPLPHMIEKLVARVEEMLKQLKEGDQ